MHLLAKYFGGKIFSQSLCTLQLACLVIVSNNPFQLPGRSRSANPYCLQNLEHWAWRHNRKVRLKYGWANKIPCGPLSRKFRSCAPARPFKDQHASSITILWVLWLHTDSCGIWAVWTSMHETALYWVRPFVWQSQPCPLCLTVALW